MSRLSRRFSICLLLVIGLASCGISPVAWQVKAHGGGLWYLADQDLLLYLKQSSFGDGQDFMVTIQGLGSAGAVQSAWRCRPIDQNHLVARSDASLEIAVAGSTLTLHGNDQNGAFTQHWTGMPLSFRDSLLAQYREKYRKALTQIPTNPQQTLERTQLFIVLDFLQNIDLPDPLH